MIVVNYVVQDGKSNWLEGMVLMCLYLMLAVTFWYYPGAWPSVPVLSRSHMLIMAICIGVSISELLAKC